MSVVLALPGCTPPSHEPNQSLVDALRHVLEKAECGELQSFIGTGFQADGLRLAVWADHHPDVYQMLGSIAWLHAEYIERKVEG